MSGDFAGEPRRFELLDCAANRLVATNHSGGAGPIVSICRIPETDQRIVAFVVRGKKLRQPRRAADHQRKNTCRQRIERAKVPNAPGACNPASLVDHVMRSPPLRLVDYDDPVHAFNVARLFGSHGAPAKST